MSCIKKATHLAIWLSSPERRNALISLHTTCFKQSFAVCSASKCGVSVTHPRTWNVQQLTHLAHSSNKAEAKEKTIQQFSREIPDWMDRSCNKCVRDPINKTFSSRKIWRVGLSKKYGILSNKMCAIFSKAKECVYLKQCTTKHVAFCQISQTYVRQTYFLCLLIHSVQVRFHPSYTIPLNTLLPCSVLPSCSLSYVGIPQTRASRKAQCTVLQLVLLIRIRRLKAKANITN